MSVTLPIAAYRRGACPTLDAPMQTGDGLLTRLRIRGGRLAPAQLARIAALAAEHGNGIVEITDRGNLQVRGLTPASAAPFARAIEAVVTIERGLVIETPPLAGDDPTEIDDPRPLAGSIRGAAMLLSARLGPKVTVIVDGNGKLNLSPLKADIRLTAIGSGQWACSVGGRSRMQSLGFQFREHEIIDWVARPSGILYLRREWLVYRLEGPVVLTSIGR